MGALRGSKGTIARRSPITTLLCHVGFVGLVLEPPDKNIPRPRCGKEVAAPLGAAGYCPAVVHPLWQTQELEKEEGTQQRQREGEAACTLRKPRYWNLLLTGVNSRTTSSSL